MPGPDGRSSAVIRPGEGKKVAFGVLGIDAAFDRAALVVDVALLVTQPFTGGDQDLLLYQIDPRDQFGNRMLHLQPRVHFQEIEIRAGIHQEFDSARIAVACRLRRPNRRGRDLLANLGMFIDQWRGRFFDDFLVPPLKRTFAFSQVDGMAVLVRQHLHLNVAR